MHQPLTIFTGIVVAAMAAILPASGSDPASYRWKSRLLLVFSPTESDHDYAAFDRSLTRQRPEVIERDLVVFRVFEKGASRVEQKPLPPEDAESLRRRYGIRSGRLTVILIGKDGGIKMVREDRAALGEIFERIDSMPMRRQEMKEKR